MGEIKFEFRNKGDPIDQCVDLADEMQLFDESNMDQLIRNSYVVDEFNQSKISQVLEHLCNPENVNIFMRSKTFQEECTETEEWYETKYKV